MLEHDSCTLSSKVRSPPGVCRPPLALAVYNIRLSSFMYTPRFLGSTKKNEIQPALLHPHPHLKDKHDLEVYACVHSVYACFTCMRKPENNFIHESRDNDTIMFLQIYSENI